MRSRCLAAVIVAALSMTLSSAGLAQASPGSAPAVTYTKSQQRAVVAGAGVCYQQVGGDSGVGIVSQKFEPQFRAFNARGADDFSLSRSCLVRSVDVVGTYFDGTGTADSHSVVVYSDEGGRPAAVVVRRTMVGSDEIGTGSFHIAWKKPVRLAPGKYWLAVRANMDFNSHGEWGWETTSVLHGKAALWKNPGDGFGSGCTTYRDVRACFRIDTSRGFMFSINRSL